MKKFEADSAEEARRQYAQLVSENIDSSHVEALEIEEDEPPAAGAAG